MSERITHIHLSVTGGSVQVNIQEGDSARPDQNTTSNGENTQNTPELENELVVSTSAPPLHLLRRGRLQPAQGWTPEQRSERAFQWGQRDTQAALDSSIQGAADNFPIRTCVWVVLYNPSGEWPRYTRSLQRFYEVVKISSGGRPPSRASPWRAGIVSRGFASIVEAEAYLAGGRYRLPSEEF